MGGLYGKEGSLLGTTETHFESQIEDISEEIAGNKF